MEPDEQDYADPDVRLGVAVRIIEMFGADLSSGNDKRRREATEQLIRNIHEAICCAWNQARNAV